MNQDFKEFFASLNANGVEFLIIGGAAFNFHATPRATKDIDIWIRPTDGNVKAFLAALSAFGFAHEFAVSDLVDSDRVLV